MKNIPDASLPSDREPADPFLTSETMSAIETEVDSRCHMFESQQLGDENGEFLGTIRRMPDSVVFSAGDVDQGGRAERNGPISKKFGTALWVPLSESGRQRLEMKALNKGLDVGDENDMGERYARTEEQGREFLELLRRASRE